MTYDYNIYAAMRQLGVNRLYAEQAEVLPLSLIHI